MSEYEEPYLHWLPEDDADTDIELGLIRMMNENRKIAMGYKQLYRVNPDQCILGRVYLVYGNLMQYSGYDSVMECPLFMEFGARYSRLISGRDIWGPIPKFTLEGEGKVVE